MVDNLLRFAEEQEWQQEHQRQDGIVDQQLPVTTKVHASVTHHKVVCTAQQQQQQPEQQQPAAAAAAAAAANIPMIVVQQMHDLLDIDAIESHKDTGDQTKDQTCQREVDLTPTAKEEANNHNPACCHRLTQSPM
jgi:hypothetical protein